MGHVPAIPESTRDSITWRLILHAEKNWPQLDKVQITCRGGFAYAAGVLPGGETLPLFRLRYGGSAHSFSFAIYSAARARYEDAVLLTGYPTGTPQEALDTACTVHLAQSGAQINVGRFGAWLSLKANGGPVSWSVTPSASILVWPRSSGTLAAGQTASVLIASAGRNVSGATLTINPGGASYPLVVNSGF